MGSFNQGSILNPFGKNLSNVYSEDLFQKQLPNKPAFLVVGLSCNIWMNNIIIQIFIYHNILSVRSKAMRERESTETHSTMTYASDHPAERYSTPLNSSYPLASILL